MPPARRRITLNGLLEVAVAACILATVFGWLGRAWWLLDLASHFPVQQAALTAVAGAILLVRRRWAWGTAAMLACAVNVAVFAPALFGREKTPALLGREEPPASRSLRVVSHNVFIKSHRYVDVAAMLDDESPDVVALVEINARWADALSPLRVRWPHVVSEPREHSFGMMLLSRLPILDSSVEDLTGAGRVTIRARVQTPDGPVTIVVFHPSPPVGSGRARRRDEELRALAKHVREIDGPVVVVGDLNCTPWSPHFRDLLRDSGLRDSRKGFGLQPTWPSPLLPLMIPIDHALVSGDVAIVDRRVGPRVGSDHLPIVVDVALRSAGAARVTE